MEAPAHLSPGAIVNAADWLTAAVVVVAWVLFVWPARGGDE